MADNLVSQCAFCPKDGVCHTVGSLFDKCSSSECISVSTASSCKNKDIHDCDNAVKHYADVGGSNSTAPALPAGLKYRVAVGEDDKCNGPHESCCEAPMKDPNNCHDSARTKDCDAKGACCCA